VPEHPAWRDGRSRVAIRNVAPEIDGGRFPAKRVVGEQVEVTADIYTDGHDAVGAVVRYRTADSDEWTETWMQGQLNDRWTGSFTVEELGGHVFTVQAWVDHFGTWRRDLVKRDDAGAVTQLDLAAGAQHIAGFADQTAGRDAKRLRELAEQLSDEDASLTSRIEIALDDELEELARRHDPRRFASTYERELDVRVEREAARFSTWYEFFPRSTGPKGQHGTFQTAQDVLPYVAELGFDTVYLPPIHPIGSAHRKGKDNTLDAGPDDVGSPWAIGSPEGGHTAVHPDLGTIEDFDAFVTAAREHGLEVALDVAIQCAPDHPWVAEHPDWFRTRPDGSIQYAENPPKRYQDIYPLDFESDDWESLWRAVRDVFLFWLDHGVRTFRVDNPHTKAFPFWEWCISQVHGQHPDAIFLSEAFTRPKVMYELAKRGFSQGYTYFTWRVHKWELQEYFTELTSPPVVDHFRPSAWPNTPDILPEHLQYGGRPIHVQRLILAATLCANYGLYGPAFELMESRATMPGKEEYAASEKYELKDWDLAAPASLREVIARINRIRLRHPALQQDRTLRFHPTDNDALLAYTKSQREDLVLVVVNLDPHWKQAGMVHLDVQALGLDPDEGYLVHDEFGAAHYLWRGISNYVELDPHTAPAHVFSIRPHVRTERDFPSFA